MSDCQAPFPLLTHLPDGLNLLSSGKFVDMHCFDLKNRHGFRFWSQTKYSLQRDIISQQTAK